MLRNIGAVIVGLVIGGIVNFLFLQLNSMFFPLPAGTDMMDSEQMKAVVREMPATAWIGVFVAHLGQAFVGGWVAARMGASHPVLLAMIVGALSLAAGIANAAMLGAPAWTWFEMPLYLLVAWLAGRLVRDRRSSSLESSP